MMNAIVVARAALCFAQRQFIPDLRCQSSCQELGARTGSDRYMSQTEP